MELFALAIAPGIAICLFIFHRDAYNREPKRNLFACFMLGAAIVLPVAYFELFFTRRLDDTISHTAIKAFLAVALIEELGKFFVLRLYAFRLKSFDEPLDGIVYSVMVAMGFATLENVLYVQEFGLQTGILRMFLAVPAHASFGVLMGYHVGKARFDVARRGRLLLRGLLWAVVFHGLYDFFLFLQGNPYVKDYISDLLLFGGAVVSFSIAIRFSLRHIRQHRLLSQQTYQPTASLSLRRAYPADIPLIRELAYKIWPVTYGNILSAEQLQYMLDKIYSEQRLHDDFTEKVEFVLVYDGVHAVGFAAFSRSSPDEYKLHKIYVLPSQQGKGTGKYIISELVKAMKDAGATFLTLNVNRHNSARNFYEKMGFAVLREEDIDIGNGYYMNDYVMQKNMKDVPAN